MKEKLERLIPRGTVSGVTVPSGSAAAKALVAGLFLLACMLAPRPAWAELCSLDNVPAATLLLPYFEVDLEAEGGVTTLMSIGNGEAKPTLARVTLWTDLGLPTIAFDIYLTGFDVETINLRDIFERGLLPGDEALLDSGPLSAPSDRFPGCSVGSPRELHPRIAAELRKAHRGEESFLFGGLCASASFADSLVRGFVTVDVVRRCSNALPTYQGYFGASGIAADDNVLWGDFFHVESNENFASGESLVRIEADATRFGHGDRTFYGFLVEGRGSDHREPLPREWSTRFFNGGAFSGGTQLLAWRAPIEPRSPFPCPTGGPSTVVLLPSTNHFNAFDEEENVVRVFTGPVDPPGAPILIEPLPYAANRQEIGNIPFGPPWDFGWLSFDLRSVERRGKPYPLSQAWVGAAFNASQSFSVGFSGNALDDPCALDRCVRGEQVGIGKLCVRGVSTGSPPESEELRIGGSATLVVYPEGCYSSSCTLRAGEFIALTDRRESYWRLDAFFCLEQEIPDGAGCDSDCLGGGQAEYLVDDLQTGRFSLYAGSLRLEVDVPSSLPAGGLCVELPGV